MAGELTYDRQLELAEQAVANARWELERAMSNTRSALVQIKRKAETGSVWSTDQVAYLTASTSQVVSWNAVLTERLNHLRRVKSWGEGS